MNSPNYQLDSIYTIPGTLIEVLGQGVLLQGPSATGKSVLALSLIDRGFRLVADDAVWVEKCNEKLVGRCPPLIQDFMVTRESGLMNVRKLLGDHIMCEEVSLTLVIALNSISSKNTQLKTDTISILGHQLPLYSVSSFVPPILIEIVVRNFLANHNGSSALDEFEHRRERLQHQASIL